MNPRRALLSFALLAALMLNASAVTHYVDLNSPSPAPPYTNWLTAATNIQDAVDAAVASDTVLVTNGLYATGSYFNNGSNRVNINKAMTVQSINGPLVTIIQGYQVPGTTNGSNAIRCVYLASGATLTGFTLTNGAIANASGFLGFGGGVFCQFFDSIVTNCIVIGNAAYRGGGAAFGLLDDCVIRNNSASDNGGGAHSSILKYCFLEGNSATTGGGATTSDGRTYMLNCILNNNLAALDGAGTQFYNVTNSVLAGNLAGRNGGGAFGGTVSNSRLTGNSAAQGGGAFSCTVINCVLASNTASQLGGGAASCSLRNCTVVGNYGGGLVNGSLINSIAYYNWDQFGVANAGGSYSLLCSCLDTGLPPATAASTMSFTNEPRYVNTNGWSDLRLQSNSPCINAGNNGSTTTTTDSDGNPRISGGTVDIGAYEFQSPASSLAYIWAQRNGLPTDGSADFTDADADGANNWQEWRADTVPTNAASALLMGTATNGVTGLVVSWASVATRSYWLERGADLSAASPFQIIASNITGVAGTKTYNDTSATNGGPYFYRVGVQ